MASSTAALRDLVRSTLTALDGWTESRFAPSQFGKDAGQRVHQSFAVDTPESTPDRDDRRQVTAQGLVTATPLVIRWAWRLRGDAQSDDYSAALDAEQELVVALLAIVDADVRPSWVLGRCARDDTKEGWMLGTISVTALHRYGLTIP